MINNLQLESTELDKLIKARIAFDNEMLNNPIGKDATGNRGAYMSLENLQESTINIMIPLGLTMKQTTIVDNGNEYLVTTLRHESGQFERSIGYLFKHEPEMDDELIKLTGRLMTYMQRYQWRSMLCIGRGSEDSETVDSSKKQSYQPKPFVAQKPVEKPTPISLDQKNAILTIVNRHKGLEQALFKALKIGSLSDLATQDYPVALTTAERMAAFLEPQIK